MECRNCGFAVPPSKRDCQACGTDNGYPNVRLAQRPEEILQLAKRVEHAEVSTSARKCKDVLDRFGEAVLGSHAVMAHSLGGILNILESDRRNYTSYMQQVRSGSRVPEENEFDDIRPQFESALFPNFHENILFACLAIRTDAFLTGYGSYALILKTNMIEQRATVFEENPYSFFRKLGLRVVDRIPPGYRATWAHRDLIAKAKLHAEISSGTRDEEFTDILLRDRGGSANSDYIEVHVFGTINRNSIERVVCHRPKHRADQVLLRKLEKDLTAIGATLEVA